MIGKTEEGEPGMKKEREMKGRKVQRKCRRWREKREMMAGGGGGFLRDRKNREDETGAESNRNGGRKRGRRGREKD